MITDESVAFALRQPDAARRRSAFWACGLGLFVIWNLSVLLGVALGSAVRDTNAFGLDATFPAVMLALALPTLTSRPTRIAAGTGAVIAVALTPVLPAGLPLLAALGGRRTRWNGWRNWGGTKAGAGGRGRERPGRPPSAYKWTGLPRRRARPDQARLPAVKVSDDADDRHRGAAVVTYGLRLTGPLLRGRVTVPAAAERLFADAATVLLIALAATAALTAGHGFAGWARWPGCWSPGCSRGGGRRSPSS